jgi:hypothetical protein
MGKRFDATDVGCHADASFGHDHVRTVLRELCCDIGREDLAHALIGEMSDDADEEYAAIEALNAVCSDDVYFEFMDGDLMLVRAMNACPDCGCEGEGNQHFSGCPALV